MGFNDVFRWAQLTWDCSGPRICQGIGRPGAERYVAGDSATDSPTDSPKEFLYHPFTLSKSIICRFYNSKRGLWGRSSRKWLFSLSKTHSGRMFFISFQEIRFYLHKEFRVADISFYLHKDFRAAEIGFSLHKEFFRRKIMKNQWYISKFSALRALIC